MFHSERAGFCIKYGSNRKKLRKNLVVPIFRRTFAPAIERKHPASVAQLVRAPDC